VSPPPRYVWFDNSVPNPKLVAITHLLIDQHAGMSAAEKAKVKGWLILQQRVEASAPVRVRVPLPAPPAVALFLEYPSPILQLAVAAAPAPAPLGSQAGEAFTEAELRQIEALADVAPRRLSFVADDEDVDLDAVLRDINTSLRDLGDITSFPSAPSIRVYDRRPRIVATAREIDEISSDMAGLPLFESLSRMKAAVSERMLTDKNAEYNWFPSFDDDGVDTPLFSSAAAGAAGGDGAAGGSWADAGGDGAAGGSWAAAGGAAAGGAAGGGAAGGGLGADEDGDDGDEIRIDLSNLSIEEPSPAPSLLGAAMTIYEEDNNADDDDDDDDDDVVIVGHSVATPSGVRRSRVSFADSPPRIIGHSVAEGRDAADAIMLVDLSPPHKRNRPEGA